MRGEGWRGQRGVLRVRGRMGEIYGSGTGGGGGGEGGMKGEGSREGSESEEGSEWGMAIG